MTDRTASTGRVVPTLLAAVAGLAAVLLVADPAAAQAGADPGVGAGADARTLPLWMQLAITFGVTLVVNLVVGGLLLAGAPAVTHDTLDEGRRSPLVSGVVGFVGPIAGAILAVVLAVTVVGLVVAVPLVVALVVLGLAGSAYGAILFGAILTRPFGVEGRGTHLLVGSVVLAAVSLVPILGGLLSGAVSAVGTGALYLVVYREYVGDGGGGNARTAGAETARI